MTDTLTRHDGSVCTLTLNWLTVDIVFGPASGPVRRRSYPGGEYTYRAKLARLVGKGYRIVPRKRADTALSPAAVAPSGPSEDRVGNS